MSKYGKYTGHQKEAILNMLGGEENIDRILCGGLKINLEVVKMVLAINRAQPFDPAVFIGSGWTIWRGLADGKGLEGEEQQDARSLALTEVDFVKAARFETCLAKDETVITGEERLSRLRKKEVIRADANIGATLVNEPNQTTLKWLHQIHGVTWFELPGTELRDSGGDRYFLCLCRKGDGQWDRYYYCGWLVRDRFAGSPALVFAK